MSHRFKLTTDMVIAVPYINSIFVGYESLPLLNSNLGIDSTVKMLRIMKWAMIGDIFVALIVFFPRPQLRLKCQGNMSIFRFSVEGALLSVGRRSLASLIHITKNPACEKFKFLASKMSERIANDKCTLTGDPCMNISCRFPFGDTASCAAPEFS